MAMTIEEWTPVPRDFRERLIWLRAQLDMSRKQMAEKLGVPYTTYLGWERGSRIQMGQVMLADLAAERLERPDVRDYLLGFKTGSVALAAVPLTDAEQMELDLLYEERRRPTVVRF